MVLEEKEEDKTQRKIRIKKRRLNRNCW